MKEGVTINLDKKVLIHLEELLYSYKNLTVEIKSLEIDLKFYSDDDEKVKEIRAALDKKIYLLNKMENALNILNDVDSTIIRMKYFERVGNKDLSARLNRSPQNVCKRCNLALDKISNFILPIGVNTYD